MPVVLDTCVLVDYFDEDVEYRPNTASRREALGRILQDNDGYMSSACAAEALYYLSKYPEDNSYEILLKHIRAKSSVCTVIDPVSDIRILEQAAKLHSLGISTEAIMTAAIAIVYQCPIVTAKLPQHSEPDEYVVLEQKGLCIVLRI